MIIEHPIFVLNGILFAYAAHSIALSGISVKLTIVYDSVLRKLFVVNRFGIFSFLVAGLITCYWSLPSGVAEVISGNMTQLMMHLTFYWVGFLVFAGSMCVSRHVQMMLLIILGKIMGLFGAFLILSSIYLYDAYPAVQQTETGVILTTIMVVIDITILPCWLFRYFSNVDRIRQS
jgi:hypothetical protein